VAPTSQFTTGGVKPVDGVSHLDIGSKLNELNEPNIRSPTGALWNGMRLLLPQYPLSRPVVGISQQQQEL